MGRDGLIGVEYCLLVLFSFRRLAGVSEESAGRRWVDIEMVWHGLV